MLRQMLAAGAVGLGLATATFAQTPAPVKSVDVTVDLTAVANPAAAAYWGHIEADLEGAIAARLGDRIGDKGMDVIVDIEEVELSNGFTETVGLADTRLVSAVNTTNLEDNSQNKAFGISIDVNQARPLIGADVDLATLTADTKVYYDAMIAAFAQAVVDKLN